MLELLVKHKGVMSEIHKELLSAGVHVDIMTLRKRFERPDMQEGLQEAARAIRETLQARIIEHSEGVKVKHPQTGEIITLPPDLKATEMMLKALDPGTWDSRCRAIKFEKQFEKEEPSNQVSVTYEVKKKE